MTKKMDFFLVCLLVFVFVPCVSVPLQKRPSQDKADFFCGNKKRSENPHKLTRLCGIDRDFYLTKFSIVVPTPRMNTCLVLETSVSGTNRLASQDVSGGPGHPVKRTCFKATCFKTNSGGNTRNVNPVRVCSGFCRRTNKHKANQKNTIMKNKILPILTVFEIFLLSVFWCLLLACSGVQARIEPICFMTKFQNIKILSSFLGGRKTFVIQDINSHARKELERGVT